VLTNDFGVDVRVALKNVVCWGGFIALCTVLVLTLGGPHGILGWLSAPFDFRAFYCAGHVVLAQANPYLVEPLRSCEISTLTPDLHWVPGLVVPAPLPPYAFPVFALLGAMPFPIAAALWAALTVAAWLRMVLLLRRLTGLGIARPLLGTLGLGLLCSLTLGQLTPLTMWLIVEAAVALHDSDERRAAIFATFAVIEPQIGGAAWLALFVLRPGTRRTLAAGIVVLLVASVAAIGPERSLQWLTQVLPVHASSELRNPYQFSLTSVLVLAGMLPAVARVLGAFVFIAAIVVAVWAARRLEVRWREAAVIVLLPPVFAILGGPFVHEHHLAAALPMAIFAYARTRRLEFVIALAFLSGPWLSVIANTDLSQVREAFWASHRVVVAEARPSALAEVAWAKYIAAYEPRPSGLAFAALVKLPMWLGVALACLPLLRPPAQDRRAVKSLSSIPVA
jgi:hypothetical protein